MQWKQLFTLGNMSEEKEKRPVTEETFWLNARKRMQELESLNSTILHLTLNFFQAIPISVIITSGSGMIVMANQWAGYMFGYGSNELAGQQIEVLIPERLRQQHSVHRQTYLRDPQVMHRAGVHHMGTEGMDLIGLRKDGIEVPLKIDLAPMSIDEGVFVISMIYRRSGAHTG
jgi:PAS domain S-box-containing protein